MIIIFESFEKTEDVFVRRRMCPRNPELMTSIGRTSKDCHWIKFERIPRLTCTNVCRDSYSWRYCCCRWQSLHRVLSVTSKIAIYSVFESEKLSPGKGHHIFKRKPLTFPMKREGVSQHILWEFASGFFDKCSTNTYRFPNDWLGDNPLRKDYRLTKEGDRRRCFISPFNLSSFELHVYEEIWWLWRIHRTEIQAKVDRYWLTDH
jgi:hypothetical protein